MLLAPFITILVLFLPSLVISQTLYSEWKERSVLTLTNAVRMDPVGFRNRYVGNFQILLPQNYPSVNPVYWDTSLSRSALVHSIDMANNCGMQHPSCDGTATGTRITKYYKGGGGWAENIAAGYSTPLAVMNGWLKDDVNGAPAGDKSDNDGHRAGIMNVTYHEMGAGYAFGPMAYNHFWTQDFGGGVGDYYPIPSASHFEINTGKTTFMLDYFATDATNATQVTLNLNGQSYPMALQLGAANKGTFFVELNTPSACQKYFFSVVDAKSQTLRYPVTGAFLLEGKSCAAGIVFQSKAMARPGNRNPLLKTGFDLKGRRLVGLN